MTASSHRRVLSLLFCAGLGLASSACSSTGDAADDPTQTYTVAPPLAAKMREEPGVPPPPAAPRPADEKAGSRVLGYVNGEVVSQRDVLLAAESQLRVIDDPEARQTKEETTLYEILVQRLVDRAAREAGIDATRDEVDRVKSRQIRDIERSGGKLEAFLAERGITHREFDELVRRKIRGERWMVAAMGAGPAAGVPVRAHTETYVRPVELRDWYDANQPRFHQPATARFRRLAIRADLSAEDRDAAVAAAKSKAEAAWNRLRAGDDWVPVYREAIAGDGPDGPNADSLADDGLIEIKTRGSVHAPWIEEFAFTKPKGELSEVTQKGVTFYVLRAEGVLPERQRPFDEVQDEIQERLLRVRRGMAYYEVCLWLVEQASIQPAELATRFREHLSASRRKLLEQSRR